MQRFIAILAVIALLIGGYVYWATRDLPSIDKVLKQGVQPTKWTQVMASDGSVILSYGKFRHSEVKLSQVSPHFIDALLATEDRRFYNHIGVDFIAMARAIFRDIRAGKAMEGGSTITQQLARNVFLTNERSLQRKVREAALAIQLEQKLSKEKILELYVNNTYFGEGAYGIAAASEIYFNKKPSQLSVDEGALLAGMPQAPSYYSPFQNPTAAKKRRDEVLDNLRETGKLEPKEIALFKEKGFHLNPSGQDIASADKAPFFNRYVITQIQKQFDLDEQSFWQSGMKIYTTLDARLQSVGSRSVRNQSAIYGRKRLNQQAALLSLNPKTGAILAYVGGKDYSVSQFDRVSQALRSPGSLFKIFTYTTAIDRGFEPTKVYTDEPVSYGDWTPQNYDRQYHGNMTLARALAISNNIVAVKVLSDLGPTAVIEMAQRMGLHANLENNLTLTLGGSGVTLLDITSAFGVLANQGARMEPYAIEKIVDAKGQVIYEHQKMRSEVLNRVTVDTMVTMMMGVVQHGTGKAADIGRPVAGKTGTSDDYRDAWFIGFTPDVITGVWVGNDDNTTMPGMTGGSLPATIWKTTMRSYLADRLITNFDTTYARKISPNDFSGNPGDMEQTDPTLVQEGTLEQDPSLPVSPSGNPVGENGQGVPLPDGNDASGNIPGVGGTQGSNPGSNGTNNPGGPPPRDPSEYSPLNQPGAGGSTSSSARNLRGVPSGNASNSGAPVPGRNSENSRFSNDIIPLPPPSRSANSPSSSLGN